MKTLKTLLLGLSICTATQAQNCEFCDVDFAAINTNLDIDSSWYSYPEIVLQDVNKYEFAYNLNGELLGYSLQHRIIRVNNDEGVEDNNKIYLPISDAGTLIRTKARTILPDGSVVEMSQDDINKKTDEEEGRTYYYFAVDGLEPGATVEYYVLKQTDLRYTGVQFFVQESNPIKKGVFELYAPENLVFAAKSYNGLPDLVQDTTEDGRNRLSLLVEDLPALDDEVGAYYRPHLQQFIYKLEYNLSNGKRPVLKYSNVAENLYDTFNEPLSKSTQKALGKFISESKANKQKTDELKVRKLEDYIKTNINKIGGGTEDLEDLEKILVYKLANDRGITKLFIQALKAMEINHELLITSNRSKIPFDPDFVSYSYLQEYALYLPDLDMYLAPEYPFARLGFIPHDWTENYGMFIVAVDLGDVTTAMADLRFIEAVPYDKSQDQMEVMVKLSEDLSKMEVDVTRQTMGYYAQGLQTIFGYLDEEAISEITEEQAKFISENLDVVEASFENAGSEYFGIEPLVLKAKLIGDDLIQTAGDKTLFQIGKLIGQQVEMYSEKERTLPVNNGHGRRYFRVLKVEAPKGMEWGNTDALNMEVLAKNTDGEVTAGFVSTYRMEGDVLVVEIEEYYKTLTFAPEDFEGYQNVINAAADFNQITLVLTQ